MPFVNDNWRRIIRFDFIKSKNPAKPKPLRRESGEAPSQIAGNGHSAPAAGNKLNPDERMFVPSEKIAKYSSLESSVIHQGELRVSLKDSHRSEKFYLVLKKCAKKSRTFLEGFESNQSKKPQFIINFDNVLKIDYKKNEKSIYLSSKGETCTLSTDDLKALNEWLDVMLKKCGFRQESEPPADHRLPPLPETASTKPLPISNPNKTNTLPKQNSDTFPGLGRGSNLQPSGTSQSLNSRNQALFCSNSHVLGGGGTPSRNYNLVAGEAASSVGSLQDHLFRGSSKNSLATDSNNNLLVDRYSSSRNKKSLEEKYRNNSAFDNHSNDSCERINHDCDGYINLDDCESGNFRRNDNQKLKFQYKSQSTDILNQNRKPKECSFFNSNADSNDEDQDVEYSSFRPAQDFGVSENHLNNFASLDRNRMASSQGYVNIGVDPTEAPRNIRYVPLEVISSKPSSEENVLKSTDQKTTPSSRSPKPNLFSDRSEFYVDLDSQKTRALKNAIQPDQSPY